MMAMKSSSTTQSQSELLTAIQMSTPEINPTPTSAEYQEGIRIHYAEQLSRFIEGHEGHLLTFIILRQSGYSRADTLEIDETIIAAGRRFSPNGYCDHLDEEKILLTLPNFTDPRFVSASARSLIATLKSALGNKGYFPILHIGVSSTATTKPSCGQLLAQAQEAAENALQTNSAFCVYNPRETTLASLDALSQRFQHALEHQLVQITENQHISSISTPNAYVLNVEWFDPIFGKVPHNILEAIILKDCRTAFSSYLIERLCAASPGQSEKIVLIPYWMLDLDDLHLYQRLHSRNQTQNYTRYVLTLLSSTNSAERQKIAMQAMWGWNISINDSMLQKQATPSPDLALAC